MKPAKTSHVSCDCGCVAMVRTACSFTIVRRMGAALILVATVAGSAAAQTTGFITRSYRDAAGEHKYAVFLPRDYDRRADWPVILYLHGAAERGTDGRKPLSIGLAPYVRERAATFPFIVVFPQAEDTEGRALTGWRAGSADGQRALAILDQVLGDFRVDRRRVILTGWSMGGYGAWSLAAAWPERFSAVVPVAGGGHAADAAKLKDHPVWAFHGSNDRAVPPSESRKMIEALEAAGAQPRYTEVAGAGHDVWRDVYAGEALYRWMLDPSLPIPEFAAIRPAPEHRKAAAAEEPFVPALELPGTVAVRLGNDALEAIATSVPRTISPGALSGRIADITDTTTAAGRQFNVWFTNISYNADLTRAKASSRGPEGVDVLLAVQNARLTIGTTHVQGGSRSAVAGPIHIVIGHRRPVWLRMIVRPWVDRDRLRLQLLDARFEIPDDNWYVTSPAGVSTRGLFMTRSRVTRELTNGLYGSKSRIEREVQSIVPGLLSDIERHIDMTDVGRLVDGFWPLPVYQPTVRVFPEAVSTDRNGLTLVLKAVAGAVDPEHAPRAPRRVDVASRDVAGFDGTELQVGLAPGVLAPLTQMLIDADVARIHCEDIPGGAFAAFANPARLAEAVPELGRFGEDIEWRSELSLAAPLDVNPEDNDSGRKVVKPASAGRSSDREIDDTHMRLVVPRALVSLAVRPAGSRGAWQPVLECEFRLDQQARAAVSQVDSATRALKVEWTGEPQIEADARFAPGYEPQTPEIDVAALRQLFAEAWNAWTRNGPATESIVPDVDMGYARLRLTSIDARPSRLELTFAKPGVRITNTTALPVVYHTQGADKPWGGPFRLEPGETHTFGVSYPLLFRHVTGGRAETFTLPAGSQAELRAPATGGPPRLFLLP